MRSLATRIGLSYLVLTALTVAIGALSAWLFRDLGGSVGRLLEENYRSVLAAENMVKELERQEAARARAQVGEIDSARVEALASRAQFDQWYREAVAGAALPEEPVAEPALLDSIRTAYQAYTAAADRFFEAAHEPARAAAIEQREVLPAAARVRALNVRLLDVNQAAMLATRARVETASLTAGVFVVGAAALLAAVSVLAGLRFARGVTRPLRRLTQTVGRVRRGHLGEQVEVTTDDEVGELGRAFNAMTERLEAYEALNVQALMAEKRKSESLVEAMPSPVIVTDAQGRVALLNDAARRLLGTHEDDDRPLAEVAPDLARRLDALPAEAALPPLIEWPSLGAPRYYRPRRTHVNGHEGGPALAVTLLEDVTPFKTLDRIKGEFFAAVSHELRSPLTSLGMALDLLLREAVGPLDAQQRDLIETAKADQERLKKLVAGLIELARLEAGADALRRTAVDLVEVLRAACTAHRLPAEQHGVRLALDVPADLPAVAGDAERLGWVLANLLGNAIRHTPPGGTVTLRACVEEGNVRVEVEDSGPGVPAEDAHRIFDPFVQLDGEEARPGSAGLGLAISRRVVEAHGGWIWTEPRPSGGLFAFTLPVEDHPNAAPLPDG